MHLHMKDNLVVIVTHFSDKFITSIFLNTRDLSKILLY